MQMRTKTRILFQKCSKADKIELKGIQSIFPPLVKRQQVVSPSWPTWGMPSTAGILLEESLMKPQRQKQRCPALCLVKRLLHTYLFCCYHHAYWK